MTLTIPANSPNGTSSCTFVTIVDDNVVESTEDFSLSINNLTPNTVIVPEGGEVLTIYILDDDGKC